MLQAIEARAIAEGLCKLPELPANYWDWLRSEDSRVLELEAFTDKNIWLRDERGALFTIPWTVAREIADLVTSNHQTDH